MASHLINLRFKIPEPVPVNLSLAFERVWPTSPLIQVSVVQSLLVIGLFCKVLIHNPGKLQRADADPRFSCIADLVQQNQSPRRFCPYCEVSLWHCFICIFSNVSYHVCPFWRNMNSHEYWEYLPTNYTYVTLNSCLVLPAVYSRLH